jgi:hypothetical protein
MLGIDHDFSSNDIKQAALDEGAYDAQFDFALHIGYRSGIERTGSVKDDAGIGGFVVATRLSLTPTYGLELHITELFIKLNHSHKINKF